MCSAVCYNSHTTFPSLLRKAKENLFGQNRSFSDGHTVSEKKQQLELDSVVEETITGDYALIINGHSLVSLPKALFFLFLHPNNHLLSCLNVFSKQMTLLEMEHPQWFPIFKGKLPIYISYIMARITTVKGRIWRNTGITEYQFFLSDCTHLVELFKCSSGRVPQSCYFIKIMQLDRCIVIIALANICDLYSTARPSYNYHTKLLPLRYLWWFF